MYWIENSWACYFVWRVNRAYSALLSKPRVTTFIREWVERDKNTVRKKLNGTCIAANEYGVKEKIWYNNNTIFSGD